jgi:hypothetical protein
MARWNNKWRTFHRLYTGCHPARDIIVESLRGWVAFALMMFTAPHVRQVGHPAHIPVGHVPVLGFRGHSVGEPRVARLVDVVIRQQNCAARGAGEVLMLSLRGEVLGLHEKRVTPSTADNLIALIRSDYRGALASSRC